MNRNPSERVAVIVALTDPAPAGWGARVARFSEEVGGSGEVLVVVGPGVPDRSSLTSGLPNVRVVLGGAGRLAPHLWRDGLLATDASLVAFTTAQMAPKPGWLKALKDQLILSNAAGVGGPIAPGAGLSNTDRAVALVRYSGYFPAADPAVLNSGLGPDGEPDGGHPHASPSLRRLLHVDPPGDNALYRRDLLMAIESTWLDGFWEVAVHGALRDRGESVAMSESAVVTFEGGVGLASMARQRIGHARRYGARRSRFMNPPVRLARALAMPLVPPLLCGRIVESLRSRKMGLGPWAPAAPRLLVLASAWAVGEAAGTLFRGPRSLDRMRESV